jgi:hypothetical protein
MVGNFGWGFIFQRIKSWARSVHRGLTTARTEGVSVVVAHSPELDLWPLRCTGSSARASPELGRRRSDRATVARRGHGKLGGEGFQCGRGERRGEVCGAPGVVGVAFIGPGEGAGGWPE